MLNEIESKDTYLNMSKDLLEVIVQWYNVEKSLMGATKTPVLAEIIVANLKTIQDDTEEGEHLRRNLFDFKQPDKENADYTISRIEDLYIHVLSMFPKDFIEAKELSYMDSLNINHCQIRYGWLLSEIQYVIRYITLGTGVVGSPKQPK